MSKKEIQLTVENAKVVNVTYNYYNVGAHGYLKEGDGLVYVSVVRIEINLKESVVSTSLKDADGKIYERKGSFGLYASTKAYESNDPMSTFGLRAFEALQRADWKHLSECECLTLKEEDGTEYIYMRVWMFENGEAVETPIVVNSIVYEDGGKWHLSDGRLPEKFWESRKDAYAFNEYKITDGDGEVFTEEGYMKRLMLTPEQWEIVNQMRDLYKKAVDAHIKFLWDRDNGDSVKAINFANVSNYGYDTGAVDNGDLVSVNEIPLADTGICFYDYCGCDGNDALALNPTPRQKKEWLKSHPQSAE